MYNGGIDGVKWPKIVKNMAKNCFIVWNGLFWKEMGLKFERGYLLPKSVHTQVGRVLCFSDNSRARCSGIVYGFSEGCNNNKKANFVTLLETNRF